MMQVKEAVMGQYAELAVKKQMVKLIGVLGYCSVLQYVVVCCSVLQCVAVCQLWASMPNLL